MNAYLAELRSIGGHSGSPVLVHFDARKREQLLKRMEAGEFSDITRHRPHVYLEIALLGVMHGHFTLRPDEHSGIQAMDFQEDASRVVDNSEDFNSGIGIVIPAKKILAVLNQKRLVEDRSRERDKVIRSQGTSTPD